MKNIQIGHKIIAVPERMQYVNQLLYKTSLDISDVLIDVNHIGCMWNAIRAWKSYRETPQVTHWCVMADDTDTVNNYIELEKKCVEHFPDAIWTFYSNELSIKHKPKNTPYIQLSSYNIRGIAFLMPISLIDGYVELCEELYAKYHYERDDATCRIYALMNDFKVMTTIPNLVRSHEIKSSMSGHGITHNSNAWQGYDVDITQFMTDAFETRHIALKSARETHLHKDNPVDIMVAKKWNRLNLLRKL